MGGDVRQSTEEAVTMGYVQRSNERFEENATAEVHRRLHSWGLWLYWQDNPGLDVDPVNILAKMIQRKTHDRNPGELPENREEWARQAANVDRAVLMVSALARPIIAIALKSRYEFMPELLALPKKDRQEWQLQQCQLRSGQGISGSRMRQIVCEGRRLVACQLPWIQDAK